MVPTNEIANKINKKMNEKKQPEQHIHFSFMAMEFILK